MEEVNFLPYLPPNSKSNRVAEGEERSSAVSSKGDAMMKVDPLWLEALEMIDGDLHWLLQQTHHKFWCQVREGERRGGGRGGERERERGGEGE
ncbi:MAG: hypothetical protein MJE68_11685 [Proteobacteria bacterium]|nr:hypothetical protein [Pseudomonadota bacterium]